MARQDDFISLLRGILGGGSSGTGSVTESLLSFAIKKDQEKDDTLDVGIEAEEADPYAGLARLIVPGKIPLGSFAEGGEVSAEELLGEMESLIEEPMMEEGMGAEGDDIALLERAADVLDDEDYGVLSEAVDMHPDLPRIFDEILMSVQEFEGGGSVDGPGTGTSDSIPAKLSDGEFVFTAKAVRQLGVDKLNKMMRKAEEDFDSATTDTSASQEFAMGGFVQRNV